MAVSQSQKEKIVRGLLIARQKATSLRARLRLLGESDAAASVTDQVEVLDARIEELLEDMMSAWRGTAQSKINQISRANTKLQGTIRGVRDRERRANEVVKAIGLLDSVIEIAAGLL